MKRNIEYLITNEVAALFQVSRRTVIRWTHAGLLEYVKPGGKLLYPINQPALQRLFQDSQNRRISG